MVDYGKTLSGALRFCVEPKRWLPLFALDVIFATGVFSVFLANSSAMMDIITGAIEGFAIAQSIVSVVFLLFGMFVVWVLVRLFVAGALIHQSVKPKEYRKSCMVSKQRFLTMLAISVIVGLLTTIAGFIPYIGWLVSIVIGLMFFFSLPAAVVDKLAFEKALKGSYRLFRDRFTEVLLSWLLIVIISGLIGMIFMIPVFMLAFNLLVPQLMAMSETATGMEFISVMMDAGWSLLPGIVVAIAGMAISTVFSVYAQTNFYVQIRKKKGIL
ncbi:MAG: hypothetical protein JXC85_00405 [Candidatus Aenigmarchaeota archaeon]|nr:hypothetical protein [Candidatus Aenigmarchaeota archaeon]